MGSPQFKSFEEKATVTATKPNFCDDSFRSRRVCENLIPGCHNNYRQLSHFMLFAWYRSLSTHEVCVAGTFVSSSVSPHPRHLCRHLCRLTLATFVKTCSHFSQGQGHSFSLKGKGCSPFSKCICSYVYILPILVGSCNIARKNHNPSVASHDPN